MAQKHARETKRFRDAAQRIGYALGGRPGERLSQCLGLPIHKDTLLERVKQLAQSRFQGGPIPAIGVDEWAWRKGHGIGSYGTILVDLEQGVVADLLPNRSAASFAKWLKEHPGVEVISRDRDGVYAEGGYVAEDRKQESLDGFWPTLTEEQRNGIKAVAMDIWDPYVDSVSAHVDEADQKIVFDKFHVAQHLGNAVDEVRRKENKALSAEGDDRLKGTRYDWLRNPVGMDPEDRRAFTVLRKSELKTARAWAMKETGMSLYNYVYEAPARKHFQWWYGWRCAAASSR